MRYLLAALLLAPSPALAVDFSFAGYGDLRFVVPSNEVSTLNGGLGKLRYGEGDGGTNIHLSEAVLQLRAQVSGALSAVVVLRADPAHGPALDILEGYVRYRPVSLNAWRWSVKAGAFFAPISLENHEIGWTSFWTLTPSAINAWVGDELKTIGAESRIEWRGEGRKLSLAGALYGFNDPTGVMIAHRGWTLTDRVTGLFEHTRDADVVAIERGRPFPIQTQLFAEIDHRVGWYAQGAWDEAGIGKIEVLRYDNRGQDDRRMGGQFAWDTHFWSGGLSTSYEDFTLLVQGMSGYTSVQPSPGNVIATDFKSAFALVGWQKAEWRVAARADLYQTRTNAPSGPTRANEDGHAFTFALSYVPKEWLRLTGEVITAHSRRGQRVVLGRDTHWVDNQFQIAARIYF